MKNNSKKNLKITYNGETKRVKAVSDYKTLVQKTQQAFALESGTNFKFYYLDEEQEIISVSSQFDLDEALDIDEPAGCLKLIIAVDASEARSILEQQFQDNASMRDLNSSLCQSQFMILNSDQSMIQEDKPQMKKFVSTGTNFDQVSNEQMKDTSTGTDFKQTHTIGVGSAVRTTEQATDVFNLIGKKNMGCDAGKVMMHDQQMSTNSLNMMDSCTQARMEVKDSSCGDRIETINQGSQMQVQNCDQEASCSLLMPSDDDFEMNDANAEQISCFKCKGSQVNKKGLPCRKCNGTGTVSSHMYGDVLEVVRNQIREMCTHSFREQIKVHLAEKQLKQAQVLHEKFICDGCDANPIKGIRYMCSVRHNYDLCEKCEASIEHQYPMLKIRFPEQAPIKLVCQYNHKGQQEKSNNPMQKSQAKQSYKSVPKKYLGRFIKENFGEKFTVSPNQKFVKCWTFRNDGKDEWPEDTLFIQTNGDEIGACSQSIEKVVQPNEEYTWSLQLKAPSKPGRYTTYFRMTTENNYRFGHKVWCDIQVVNPSEPEQINMPLDVQPQIQQANVKVLAEKRPPLTVDQKPSENKPVQKEISSFAVPLSKEELEKKQAIDAIKDLGFNTEEKVIAALFDKYKKVDIVAAVLAEARLSESAFEVVSKATN